MTGFRIDYDYGQSEEVIKKLDPTKEEDRLILYHINYWKSLYEDERKRCSEYQEVFDKIARFLPNNNPTFR